MGQVGFSDFYPAIKDARAGGKRPADVQRKLRAGTLPGASKVASMSETTFWSYWRKAERELRLDDERKATLVSPVRLRAAAFIWAEDGMDGDAIVEGLENMGADPEFAQTIAQAITRSPAARRT